MEPRKNYFTVGVFVLATALAALGFTIWLTASGKGDTALYRIQFSESVSGLSVGGLVKFRGVDVGHVEKITINPADTRLIQVDIRVLTTTPVKTDTVASLKLQGITGVVFVELTGGSPGAKNLVQNDDDPPLIKAEQSSIDAIVNRLPMLLEKATVAIDRIDLALSDQNVRALGDVITNARDLTAALAQESGRIDLLLRNANATVSDVRGVTASSRRDIQEMTAHLNHTAGQADALVQDLRKTARNVSALSQSLKENPSRILFPEKEKGVPAP